MKIVSLVVASALVLSTTSLFASSGREDSIERLHSATDVLHTIQSAPDHGIPDSVLNAAKCIIVVPNLVKGGFIFGAKHGRGIATCRTENGWSAPAFISIGGGSWGLQIGVEEVDLVMLVMNDRGLQHMLSSKFELSGQGAVAAGPVGRQAVAGTDWTLNTEVLSYSRTHGVFAGLTLEGAVVEQDNDSTWAIYDHQPTFRYVLSGKAATPASADQFIAEVDHISAQAHEDVK
jgi:lipid-binding SYLF domain-containing protein